MWAPKNLVLQAPWNKLPSNKNKTKYVLRVFRSKRKYVVCCSCVYILWNFSGFLTKYEKQMSLVWQINRILMILKGNLSVWEPQGVPYWHPSIDNLSIKNGRLFYLSYPFPLLSLCASLPNKSVCRFPTADVRLWIMHRSKRIHSHHATVLLK